MRYFLKKLIPIFLALLILLSVCWYFLIYDTTLTRDLLLQQARNFEREGNTSVAVWFYNLAYLQSGNDEAVAIELAEQLKAIGNYSKAESTLTDAIRNGGGIDVYIALCKTYIEQDKLRDAITMLDKVANKQIKAELDALRPSAPQSSAATGTYNQYLQLDFTVTTGTLYLSTDLDYPTVKDDLHTGPLTLPAGQTTVYALCIGENGLVSPLAVYGYIVKDVVEEVTFVDRHFEEAIRTQLQIPHDQTIFSDMLWKVDTFTIPAQAESCEDLKWLPGLKQLTIENGIVTDFSPLAGLTGLQTLQIVNTIITDSDLSFLSDMGKLTKLTLSGCSISTISRLEGLTNLRYLDLSNNTIRNISALSGMTMLQELYLSGNALISLADIENLTSLKILDASYNFLSTTSHVMTLINLQKLDVTSNNLMKLEGIGSLTNLEHFAAAYNNLIDVDLLAGCKKLKTLDVSHNTLLNIQVLSTLPLLEELDFSDNEVSRLPSFSADCALTVIRGEHNLLTSLDALSGLKHLVRVYMDYNDKLSNINSLRHCKALREVHVYGTKVTDISLLADVGILVHYTPKT